MGANGQYRLIATAIGAAAGGNVTGGATQFVQSAAVNYLQGLGASKIKDISGSVGGEGSPGHIALHAVLACSGAAALGANCGAGAVGASASIVVNSLLQKISGKDSEMLGAEEKDQRANQLVSIIAGIAGALSPEQAATIANAARLEAENNTLRDHTTAHTQEFKDRLQRLARCVGDESCKRAMAYLKASIDAINERDWHRVTV
jgi:filamentous hemagglutinin